MAHTLLVVDGRGFPRPLMERMEASGYVCLHARGPLRAQALLAQHTVDLILWKDNTGDAGLGMDLFAAWRAYPALPVVRVFPKGMIVPAGAGDGWEYALAANVPALTPEKQLVAVVGRCLLARRARPPGQSSGNELAFRHVVASMLVDGGPLAAESGSPFPEDDGPHTAVSEPERELLREVAPTLAAAGGAIPRVLRRVLQRWGGPRRDAAAPLA